MTTQQFQALEIPTSQLMVSPLNVRRNVGDISELADSISEQGILEPLIVRPSSNGNYEVIIGSRRLAAATQIGLQVIPVVVQHISDADAIVRSLVENLQRGELSLDERVEAYKLIEQTEPDRFSDRGELARVIGRARNRVIQDFEAHEAATILRPRGVDVLSGLRPSTPQRRSGEAIPERHATLLEQAMAAVKGRLSEEKAAETYTELAKTIAPLEQDRARRLLDYFKMYPERPISEVAAMALSTVQREITLPAETARQLEEITAGQGSGNWSDTITRLVEEVETQRRTPPLIPDHPVSDEQTTSEPEPAEVDRQEAFPSDSLDDKGDSNSSNVENPPIYRGIELPQAPVAVQQVNKVLWNLKHSVTADFYTIGYSGRDIEQFINVIEAASVSTVIDIRNAPVSQYKPDFSKDNLRAHLRKRNINYKHHPDLGVPTDVRRQAADTNDRGIIWEWYQQKIIGNLPDDMLTNVAKSNGTVAFMCMEVDPEACHRHLVFIELERAGLKGYDL